MLFEVDGDQLNISLSMQLDDVIHFYEFIKDKLDYIEAINIEDGELKRFETSALFQLLVSIKKTKPSLSIPIIDNKEVKLSEYGTIKWVIDNG